MSDQPDDFKAIVESIQLLRLRAEALLEAVRHWSTANDKDSTIPGAED